MTELADSLAGLHRAAADLRREADRLAESLRGANRDLRESVTASGRAAVDGAAQSQPAGADSRGASAHELLPQVVAAFVPIVAFALVDVHLALAAAVAVVGVVLLQVRWWMLAVSTVSLLVLLLIEPGLREGATVDRVAALIVLFALMAFALILQELWERLRRRRSS